MCGWVGGCSNRCAHIWSSFLYTISTTFISTYSLPALNTIQWQVISSDMPEGGLKIYPSLSTILSTILFYSTIAACDDTDASRVRKFSASSNTQLFFDYIYCIRCLYFNFSFVEHHLHLVLNWNMYFRELQCSLLLSILLISR